MKKLLLTTALVAVFGFASVAQEQGDIRVRTGLVLGTKASADEDTGDTKAGLGINLGAEYMITDAISIAPSYTLFFKTEFAGGVGEIKPSVFNVDARYYFGETGIYGLVGAAFQSVKFESDFGDSDGSATTFNVGAGIELPISDALNFNGQVKYMGTDDEETFEDPQLVVGVGVSFKF